MLVEGFNVTNVTTQKQKSAYHKEKGDTCSANLVDKTQYNPQFFANIINVVIIVTYAMQSNNHNYGKYSYKVYIVITVF